VVEVEVIVATKAQEMKQTQKATNKKQSHLIKNKNHYYQKNKTTLINKPKTETGYLWWCIVLVMI
jgi:hypothetical protein